MSTVESQELAAPRSTAVQVKRQFDIVSVLLLVGEGNSVKKACELAGVSESAWYDWQRKGYVEPFLQRIKENAKAGLMGQLEAKWNDVVRLLFSDASDTDLNAAHRDRARRTLLLALKQLAPKDREAFEDRENAREWLRRRGLGTTVVAQNVVIDQRQPGDYSPILCEYVPDTTLPPGRTLPVTDVVDAETVDAEAEDVAE